MKEHVRKSFLVVLVILWGVFIQKGFSDAQETLKIGLITGLTGGTASWGAQIQRMGKILSEEINEAGGFKLGDRKVRVEFIYYDSESNPEVAATQAEKAISSGCKFISAGPQSAVDFTVSEHCERAGVIYVNACNVLDKLTERGYEHYFRSCGDIDVYVNESMNYLLEQEKRTGIKARKVAIFTADNVVCSFAGDKYKELIPKMAPHWEIAATVKYPEKSTDFTMWLNSFKAQKIDLLLGINYPSDSVFITRQLREINYTPLAIHGVLGGQYDPEYGNTLKWQSIYTTDTSYFSADLKIPGLAEFDKKYKERWGDSIPANSANLACGITLIKDTVERAGSLDTKALLTAMRATDITRVEYKKGEWWYIIPSGCKFNKQGENVRQRGVTTMWVSPVDQKPVFPFEYATHNAPWPRPAWEEIEKEYGSKYPLK
jgi:branched-chain amino acid transport system substrate-binding protein